MPHRDMSSTASRHMGQRLRLLAGLAAGLLAVGFMVVHAKRSADERDLNRQAQQRVAAVALVDVAVVKKTPSGLPLVLPGETAAWSESTIYARVSGYVDKWNVDIGDHVAAGQVLAQIDTPELDADLVAAKAKLRSAEAEVKVREARADFANTTYVRWRDSPKGVVSEQEQADKKAQFESARAELTAAQAQVVVDQAEVDRLTSFVEFKQVTAPYAGVITERRIDIGNLVAAGSSPQTTPLFRMSQSDPMRVFVNVPQSAASDLMKVGTPADIAVGDLAGRHLQGGVARTSQSIDPHSRTFRVEIDLPNGDQSLLPGLYVQVGFQLPSGGTVQIPAAALVLRPDGPHAAVVAADGKVRFKALTLARDDGNMVEVSSGVAEGDQVILNVSSQIAPDDAVQIAVRDGQPVEVK